MQQQTRTNLLENAAALQQALNRLDALAEPLEQAAGLLRDALLSGQQLLCCGNGGSAADSAHFAAEIAGRFQLDRPGYRAVDLTAQHALMTALTNDYPPEEVFARQVQALGRPGDVLAAFSTSGGSENVRRALLAAREHGLHTIAFLGRDGGACRDLADVPLVVPAEETARTQELHLVLYHTICQTLDPVLAQAGEPTATEQPRT